jgi:L-fuconolactonase
MHFWDPGTLRYPWLDEVPGLRRAFLPEDYAPLVSGTVDAVVFVEANCLPAQSAAEVEFVDQLAAKDPRIAGTIAFAEFLDENDGGLEVVLDRLSQNDRVAGVRHNIQGHPAGYCTDERFVLGVQLAGEFGLTFDLCATAQQLAEVAQLVELCPETQFVLDHCGKPAIRDDAFAPWARDLALVAAYDNVSCKLSGLLTEARADQRGADGLTPYAAHVTQCFGASRLLYGSDWPVCTLGGGATAWRAFVDHFTEEWSSADRQRFYADNAIRLYGLELHAHS